MSERPALGMTASEARREVMFAMCADCEALMLWAGKDADCFCWSFGDDHGDVIDFFGESGDRALIADADTRVKNIRNKRRDPIAA